MAQNNPLLNPTTLQYNATPFNDVKDEHFASAFDEALAEARANIARIKAEKSDASFENTIEALEGSSERLDRVSSVFSNLLHAHTNDTLQGLAKEVMPKLAEFSNDIYLDGELFKRVKAVNDRQGAHRLDLEQAKLLEKTYKAFVRNGALLDEAKKEKLREIDRKLSVLGQQYGENVLKATNAFELLITQKEDLAGLPESAVEGAAQAAEEKGKEKGKEGWLFTLAYPSLGPFLKFSEKRELREKMWRASVTKATSGETDNRSNVKELAKLRYDRAKLLGYATHAHFVLEERMATNPETVRKFLDRLIGASKSAAQKDLEELKEISGLKDLKPWDVAFYSEKLQQKKCALDQEVLRPYFQLENAIAGVFEHARRLYGIVVKERKDLPVYHPDVRAYEVSDEKSGEYVGLFYGDFFPRASKQNGAWMTTFRDQGLWGTQVDRPHVSIVCNFTKPTATKPSLLTLDEVRTLFHEFGHSLHALLSKCKYRSISGANVYWDFVELPSQIMENWMREKEGLDLFAKHYQTGEKIPQEMVDKIKKSSKFQAGYMSLRQVNFGVLDMAWHGTDPSGVTDVEAYEREAMKDTTLFEHVPGAIVSCSFSHIFAGGYSAGYYSYKWAEVLEADAFELFREKGIFDREVATKFKDHILSRGGTEHPMELYKRFRGREPDTNALLRRDGLI